MVNSKRRKKVKYKTYKSKKQKRKDLRAKKIAKEVAKDISGSENVKVHKRYIPSSMIRYIERNIRVKFKKKPKFYTYSPKKGHRFKPKKYVGGWDGASVTCYNTGNGKIDDTVVILPKSHLKNKKLKENVLLHELTETLVGQHMIKPGGGRSPKDVRNFEHKKFAMVYEKKHLDKNNLKRQQISHLAKKMWNKYMAKKQKKRSSK
jgi:hypothetical protein